MPAHFEFSADASLRSRQWLESAQPGFCGYTVDRQRNLCSRDSYGSFGLSEAASTSSVRAVAVCLKHCDSCERCNFITVNPGERDCSWYHTCNTSKLLQHYPGFLSGAVSTAGKKAVAESLKLPSQPVVQNVVLFIHMEKTGGTLVRNLFARGNWSSTGYCKRTEDVIPDVQRALLAGTRKIFVEHHCSLNWCVCTTPNPISVLLLLILYASNEIPRHDLHVLSQEASWTADEHDIGPQSKRLAGSIPLVYSATLAVRVNLLAV
mmetsp:Transcript_5739/g.12520  ORF Transcript_5739/g.12520 Transcript_5739/m.12520 type:complete len:264 (-) Transcript_5739:1192-1983(-)